MLTKDEVVLKILFTKWLLMAYKYIYDYIYIKWEIPVLKE